MFKHLFDRFNESELEYKNGTAGNVTMLDWFLFDLFKLIAIIPVVGAIAFIILYIVLAFRKELSQPIKARVRLDLIYAAISMALALILSVLGVVTGISTIF